MNLFPDHLKKHFFSSRLIAVQSLLLAGLLTTHPLSADVHEGFDYTVGANLNATNSTGDNWSIGLNGGTGWNGGWGNGAGTAANRTISAGTLSYPNVISAGGKLEANASRCFRRLSTPINSGTHYVQVMVQKVSGGSGYFGLSLIDSSNTERMLIGQATGASHWTINQIVGGNMESTAGNENFNTLLSTVSSTEMALLVVKVEFQAISAENPSGSEKVTFWVNPDLSKPERVVNAVTGKSYLTANDMGSIARVRVGGGGTASVNYTDEIRINSTSPFAPGPEIVIEDSEATRLNQDDEIDFNSVKVTESGTFTLTVRNLGNANLSDLGVTFSGVAAADYSVSSISTDPVAPNGSTTITVNFTPSVIGTREADLTLASNDVYEGTFKLGLTGIGLAPKLVVEETAGTALENGTASINLGSAILTASPLTRTITIRNDGNDTLTGLALAITGTDSADFGFTALTATELAPTEETTFTLSFSPSVIGARNANLSLTSNDPNENPFEISLTGTGLSTYGASKPLSTPTTEGALLTAAPLAWTDDAAGLYDGLLHTPEGTLLGAFSSVKVSKPKAGSGNGGALTGTLLLNGSKVNVKGAFDSTGLLALTLPQKDGSSIVLNLQLQRTSEGPVSEVIRGTLTWGDITATANLPRAPYDKKNPAPESWSGSFTMLVPTESALNINEPGGDGWATVSISSAGAVRVTGELGDGTKFIESAFLSSAGEFSLFSELYKTKPKGHAGGRIVFRDQINTSDFDGKLQWVKKTDAKEKIYAGGFSVERWIIGSRYVAPATGDFILPGLTNSSPNASVSLYGSQLAGTGLEGELARVVTWNDKHQWLHYGPEKLQGKTNKSNGALSGSFQDPVSRQKLTLKGVVFQKQDIAAGAFLIPSGSALLRVKAGTDYPYPGSENAGALATITAPDAPAPQPVTEAASLTADAAGLYNGVLTNDEATTTGVLENFKLTSTGSFTATLWHLGTKYTLAGTLDANGKAAGLSVAGAADTMLDLSLEKVTDDGGYVLRGALTQGSSTYALDAQMLPPGLGKNAPSRFMAAYTLAIAPPNAGDAGYGYGTLQVNASAICSGVLVLADGTKTTFAGHVSNEGEWTYHSQLKLKGATGYLAGKLTLRNTAFISDVDGELRWVKDTGDALTSLDWNCAVIGAYYLKPAKGIRAASSLTDDYHNAWARFSGANLATPATPITTSDKVVTWDLQNKITYYGAEKLTFKFNPATGVVTGSYQDKDKGIKQSFSGVLIQEQDIVAGFYLGAADQKSGTFLIEPRGED